MKEALGTISLNNSIEKVLLPEPSAFGSVSLEALHPNGRMPQSGIIAMEQCHLHVGLLMPLNKEAEKRAVVVAQVLDIDYKR